MKKNTSPLKRVSQIPPVPYLDHEPHRSVFIKNFVYTSDGAGLAPFGTFLPMGAITKINTIYKITAFNGDSLLFTQEESLKTTYIYRSLSSAINGSYSTTINTLKTTIKIPSISTATATYIVLEGKIREIYLDGNSLLSQRVVTITGFDDNIVNILYINGLYCIIGDNRKFFFTDALGTTITAIPEDVITIPTSADNGIINGVVNKNNLYLLTSKSILVWRGKTSFSSTLPITFLHSNKREFYLSGKDALLTYNNNVYAIGKESVGEPLALFLIQEGGQAQVTNGGNLAAVASNFSLVSLNYQLHHYVIATPIYEEEFFIEDNNPLLPYKNNSFMFCLEKETMFLFDIQYYCFFYKDDNPVCLGKEIGGMADMRYFSDPVTPVIQMRTAGTDKAFDIIISTYSGALLQKSRRKEIFNEAALSYINISSETISLSDVNVKYLDSRYVDIINPDVYNHVEPEIFRGRSKAIPATTILKFECSITNKRTDGIPENAGSYAIYI